MKSDVDLKHATLKVVMDVVFGNQCLYPNFQDPLTLNVKHNVSFSESDKPINSISIY